MIQRQVGVLVLAIILSGPAAAQSYPDRIVKIVVPAAPGGTNDVPARLIAQHLTSALGQNVIVENRASGAGGTLGTRSVATSDPDGYTLLFAGAGQLAVGAAVYRNPGYDPVRSFAAVATVISSPVMLVVHPALPVHSVQELVAYAKAHPGRLSFASPGVGTLAYLTAELFKQRAQVDIAQIPYRGSAPAAADLLAGQAQAMFSVPTAVLPHVREGRLRALAVAADTRSAEAADVPTLAEAGLPGLIATLWQGVVAPAGTPPAIIERLNAEINRALRRPEMKAAVERIGGEVLIQSPQEFAALIAADVKRWTEVASAAGIRID
jgi:tripartite-type tricarboxylate transporter receptor subunit TctC